MCSFADFPDISKEEHLPCCDIDGKLHYSKIGHADVNIYTSAIASHPVISLPVKTEPVLQRHPGRDVFLPSSGSLLNRLLRAWYEHDTYTMLEVLADENEAYGQKIAQMLLRSISFIDTLKGYVGYHHGENGLIRVIKKMSSYLTARVICWHPHCTKLALLYQDSNHDECITVFSPKSTLNPILKARNMTTISSIAWRPLSSSELAVGCAQGIYLWHVDPNSVIAKPSINSAVHLSSPDHIDVSTVAWNPQGNLLASGSYRNCTILIWHVDTRSAVSLRRAGGHGTALLLWSPDGMQLLQATYSNIFRLWKCNNDWTCDSWQGHGCSIVTASFSPSSKQLVFATSEEPFLYCLDFENRSNIYKTTSDKHLAHVVADFTPTELPNGSLIIGGPVIDLAWDDRGHFLAVAFETSSRIALFKSVFTPHFHLIPQYFIYGTSDESPSCIAFEHAFKEGANLTIGWSSGRVQYFPIIYKEEESTVHMIGMNTTDINQSSQHYLSFNSPVTN